MVTEALPRAPHRIGPYRFIRQLGQGGMGSVYEAVHEVIERRVAIKVLLPEFMRRPELVTRFLNEARAVNRIAHPGIVQISDCGHLQDGTAFIVMELLQGQTLRARLNSQGGVMSIRQAVQLGLQLAEALCAAHNVGIVHRDLKPENVMVVADQVAPGGERIKLLDFGIAKLTSHGESLQQKTECGALMGTPSYMSPEQCRGAGLVDDKTDVYALGVVLYELCSGRCPFLASGCGEVMAMHLFRDATSLRLLAPHAPPSLLSLVDRMLIKDKAHRPTMREVAAALTGVQELMATGEPIAVQRIKPPRRLDLRRAIAPLAILALTSVSFAALYKHVEVPGRAPERIESPRPAAQPTRRPAVPAQEPAAPSAPQAVFIPIPAPPPADPPSDAASAPPPVAKPLRPVEITPSKPVRRAVPAAPGQPHGSAAATPASQKGVRIYER